MQLIEPIKEQAIKQDTEVMLSKVETFACTTQEDYTQGAELMSALQDRIKRVDKLRAEVVDPLNLGLKNARSFYKKLSEPYESAKAKVRAGMEEYVRLEEARRFKEYQEAQKNAKKDEEIIVEKQPTKVLTDKGTVHTRKRWIFEIENIDEVPREYLMLDTVKVNQAISAGQRTIAGLKIYEKTDVIAR